MGNTGAKPSPYVAKQWIDDRDSNQCHMCCKTFSPARRRHHCRCCGELFCNECWGTKVALPVEYGYGHGTVPVCTACGELFSGKLRFLRMPRRIVLTRALAKNQAMARPPLCKDFQQDRRFEVFFTKIAHWRPLNDHTHLIFAVTMRTANRQNSSHFNVLHVASTSETRTEPSSPSRVPQVSDLDIGAMRARVQMFDDLSDNESPSDAVDRPANNLTASPAPRQPTLVSGYLGAAGKETGSRKHTTGDVQLDVAWSLSLDAILRVALDVHPEGDYISIETHQEIYRIQVAEPEGAVTAEQEVNTTPFRAGGTSGGAAKKGSRKGVTFGAVEVPRTVTQEADGDDDDPHAITSKPRKNVVFRALPAETNGLFLELQQALHLMETRAANRAGSGRR